MEITNEQTIDSITSPMNKPRVNNILILTPEQTDYKSYAYAHFELFY